MDSDVLLVVGVTFAFLGFPTFVNAYSQSRFPKLAVILFAIGAALIFVANDRRMGGYEVADLPGAFARVFSQVWN
jgi:hypothetical protein